MELGLNMKMARYLVENYGKKTDVILKQMKFMDEESVELSLLKSELHYTVEREMTCTSVDFFARRTGRLYFNIDSVLRYKDEISKELAVILNWTEDQLMADRELLQQEIDKAIGFKQSS